MGPTHRALRTSMNGLASGRFVAADRTCAEYEAAIQRPIDVVLLETVRL